MDYVIETNFTGPNFVMVPNAVAQSGKLSAEALGVLVYMASLPRGFLLRVSSVQETFGMGKDKWQRIARELRAVGAMDVQIVRGSGGRAIGRRVAVRWPDFTESRKTQLSDRKPEKPTVGKPAKQGRKIRQTGPEKPAPYKDQKQKLGATDKKGAPAPQPEQVKASDVNAGTVVQLSGYERQRVRDGLAIVLQGALLAEGSAAMDKLRNLLLSDDCLEELGASHA